MELTFITAMPRMALYIDYGRRVYYEVYLKYFVPEDMHIYSIDGVFIDATIYLGLYRQSPRELAIPILRDMLRTTGLTATAGIGTNMYLAKVAMDIAAKKIFRIYYAIHEKFACSIRLPRKFNTLQGSMSGLR